ncbi:hypothetical protein LR48_Vigan07g090800 [Vigna angularis]|uniref:O-methyltransferase domain-containing protein n=1 Tax=Phaseolus angularis TaxID=3914 RepID=A0A0L9UXD1_PHAAN|nr:hypothetical protein LR48_Vigan07g090800 [Vigna angularis]
MSLKCVVELGIADIIHNHGQPISLSNLIASLPIHSSKTHFIPRLMRIMVHSGFFSQHSHADNELEVKYALTDASFLLVKSHEMSMAPFLQATLDPVLSNPWTQFSSWFKNGITTPFEMTHGKSFWEYAGSDPRINILFNDAMASDAQLITSSVIDKCKDVFMGLESLVDVGGGTGTMGKVIAASFPQLECIVFDLPHVVSGLQGSENLKYVGGDMFEAIPPADAILLKECVSILKKCKEAISKKGKEGKVIIIDIVMNNEVKDEESVETRLFFDMLMMVVVKGKERNEKEWVKLFCSAGFNNYTITPLGSRSLIQIYP